MFHILQPLQHSIYQVYFYSDVNSMHESNDIFISKKLLYEVIEPGGRLLVASYCSSQHSRLASRPPQHQQQLDRRGEILSWLGIPGTAGIIVNS